MTQEEYKARRKELQDEIFNCRQMERQEILKIEDDKHLTHRNAAEKIKAFNERVEREKIDALRYLNKQMDEVHRKYAEKIKAFNERVEREKIDALRYLNKQMDEVHRKYAGKRAELDTEIKVLDAELKRAYYVNLKERNDYDKLDF
ncbi:MAG: hypothetical protein ACI3YT_07265 [Prevotella sp.]